MTQGLIRKVAQRFAIGRSTMHVPELHTLANNVEKLRLQVGAVQARQMLDRAPATLADAEFRVFSQFGEDGIIQFLLSKVGPIPKSFVEFGVETYDEANTRFLLLHDGWRGLIMDGSAEAMTALRQQELYWRHDLRAEAAFIDRDNVDALIARGGMRGPIGLLSVDIDGNDYWVWEKISVVDPVIVVVEYNSTFGAERAVSIPYAPDFQRTLAHFSNLYWGCSLAALCHLASRKGYVFVGSNSAGNNAFFVQRDYAAALAHLTPAQGYVESRFRESRDPSGALTFLSGAERLRPIAHLPLIDVTTGETLTVEALRTS